MSAVACASVAEMALPETEATDTRRMTSPKSEAAMPVTLEHLLANNPRLSINDIRHLQEWLEKQPHLPSMFDEDLVPFLVSNDYSLERTKECVDKCLTMRTHAPELFKGRDPAIPENQAQLQAFRVARLPLLAPGNRRMIVMGYASREHFPPANFDGVRSLALSTALMELVSLAEVAESEGTTPGVVLLMDTAHVTMSHMAGMPLMALHRLFSFLQEAAPLRVQSVYLLRLGSLGRRALALVKPFMGADLQRMMHFYSDDMTEFYKEFPREILPEDFGGTCGTIAEYHQQLVAELLQRRQWVLAQESRGVDETKRPGGSARAAIFGIEGSFRRLQVD